MILGYCRCSTEEQVDGASLDEQERRIRGLAQMRGADKYDIEIYVDGGVSGSTPLSERPNGARMLEAARKGDIIVASKLDRLFRSACDALQSADSLKAKGVDLILLDMGSDPVTGNGAAKLFFTMLAAIAEFERTRIAERIEEGRRHKRDKKGHTGGSAPYGYRISGDGRESRLVEDPEEMPVLEHIKACVAANMSPWNTLKSVRENGFTTRTNKGFQMLQVQRIMRRVANG